MNPPANDSDNDVARVRSCHAPLSVQTSSPKHPTVSDVGQNEASQATNSSSSRRRRNEAAAHAGDELRERSARPACACKTPAYLGAYVRNVNDAPKGWETVPNPVNAPGTHSSDSSSWEPRHPKMETASLANFCSSLLPENLDSASIKLTCLLMSTDTLIGCQEMTKDRRNFQPIVFIRLKTVLLITM